MGPGSAAVKLPIGRVARVAQSQPPQPPINLRPTPAIQRAAAKTKPHSTKAGKIKDATIEYLKNLPKGTKEAEIVGIWEVHHRMLDQFAVADKDGLPAGTTGNLPQKLDLAKLQAEYYLLGKMLIDAVANAVNNDRGSHGNDEGKLPTYTGVPTPYQEYGFLKGGGRLVVDTTSNRQYISLHYSTFYRVV
jgi:hypothetical protein